MWSLFVTQMPYLTSRLYPYETLCDPKPPLFPVSYCYSTIQLSRYLCLLRTLYLFILNKWIIFVLIERLKKWSITFIITNGEQVNLISSSLIFIMTHYNRLQLTLGRTEYSRRMAPWVFFPNTWQMRVQLMAQLVPKLWSSLLSNIPTSTLTPCQDTLVMLDTSFNLL